MTVIHASSESIALHSGEYVERYNRKPLDRVCGLMKHMAVGPEDEVADFACGNGMLLQLLGSRAGKYHGVDFSHDFIRSANSWAEKEKLRNYEFYCEDIITFCNNHVAAFDIATTLDFSEHIDDDTAVSIYSAIRRSLRPGGKLYLHTPNFDFFMERAKDIGLLKQFPEHIAVRNGMQTASFLVQAGFDPANIDINYIPHYNMLKYIDFLSRIPFVGKYFRARLWVEAKA